MGLKRHFLNWVTGGFVTFSLFCETAAQATLYVDQSKAGGNGSSWSQAFKTIEAAVAATSGNDEIWVARGTYSPAPTSGIYLKPNLKVYGGFAGNESSTSQRNVAGNPTIVDGRNVMKHVFAINSAASGSVIDGFSIIRGRAVGALWDSYGGGVLIDQAVATVANCSFSNNVATTMGGAVFVYSAPATILNCRFVGNSCQVGGGLSTHDNAPQIVGCTFIGNTVSIASGRGAAIWINLGTPRISGCYFEQHSAEVGGAVDLNNATLATVADSTFVGNSAASAGGAIANNLGALLVANCTFRNNTSGLEGGAVYSYYTAATVRDSLFWNNSAVNGGGVMFDYKIANHVSVVERCRFVGNHASTQGGGVYGYARSMQLDNCMFSYNDAPYGGAIRVHAGLTSDGTYDANHRVYIRNCSIYGNSASQYGGGLCGSYSPMMYVYNTIMWGNSASTRVYDSNTRQYVTTDDIFGSGSCALTTRYSDLAKLSSTKGCTSESHTGSYSVNPLFSDPNGPDNSAGTPDDDLTLQSTSPCLDRADGNNAPATDLLGSPRVDLPGISNTGTGSPNYGDAGAFEMAPRVATPTVSPDSSTFQAPVTVFFSCATGGATIRYTTDGSTPTASSPAASSLQITRETTLKIRAFLAGYVDSDVKTATYGMLDSDGDGLPNWVETNTGRYVSETSTGTDPSDADSDDDGFTDGREVARQTDPNDAGSYPSLARLDFDGDGESDVAVYHPAAGGWYVRQSSDNQLMSGGAIGWGWSDAQPEPGDYDGDGKCDIAVYHAAAGNWYIRQSSNGQLMSGGPINWGWSATTPVAADYDGDGKTDLAVFHAAAGNWYIRQSSDGKLMGGGPINWGWSSVIPVPEDYDGDGKCDIAVFFPSTGEWFVRQSSDGKMMTGSAISWGWSEVRPVPADYDGDGRADIAVYHAAAGNWYIRQSSDGKLMTGSPIPLGNSSMGAVPADYDGDGAADITVYQQSTGNWYQRIAGQTLSFGFGWSAALAAGAN